MGEILSEFKYLTELSARRSYTPKRVQDAVETVIGFLQEDFGVKNLTNLELFQIRRDATDIIKETARISSHFTEENADEAARAISTTVYRDIDEEILFRFFSFYGIDLFHMPHVGPDVCCAYIEKKLREAREEYHKPYLD